MRLGNDHTSGTAPGRIAPLSAFADNDYALGMVVEAVSKSKFWPTTAIFRTGRRRAKRRRPRRLAPLSRFRHFALRQAEHSVDSTMYNTTSMLRTMELILGLRPMTHFDAAARPMFYSFQPAPDTRPYIAEKRASLSTSAIPLPRPPRRARCA
jgi:hypothetical protein